jgi:hypothetical protein
MQAYACVDFGIFGTFIIHSLFGFGMRLPMQSFIFWIANFGFAACMPAPDMTIPLARWHYYTKYIICCKSKKVDMLLFYLLLLTPGKILALKISYEILLLS